MRVEVCCFGLAAFASVILWCPAAHAGDGPTARRVTDPKSVVSTSGPAQSPLPVEALLTTVRINGVAHSRDGQKLVYTSNASGRPNLWIMNTDGTGAQQIVKNNDRQGGALFTADGQSVVYSQDRGGDEYFDIWTVSSLVLMRVT